MTVHLGVRYVYRHDKRNVGYDGNEWYIDHVVVYPYTQDVSSKIILKRSFYTLDLLRILRLPKKTSSKILQIAPDVLSGKKNERERKQRRF